MVVVRLSTTTRTASTAWTNASPWWDSRNGGDSTMMTSASWRAEAKTSGARLTSWPLLAMKWRNDNRITLGRLEVCR